MSEPLEIRRRIAPWHARLFAFRAFVALVGMGMVVSCLVALVTQPLGSVDRIDALGLVALGALILWWGGLRTWKVRTLLRRPVVIRLDDRGVQVAAGTIERPFTVSLAWTDTAGVEVMPAHATVVSGAQLAGESMLRFVPRADALVQGVRTDGYTERKAALLGLSNAAASLALLQSSTSSFRVPVILDWLRQHRPEIPVRDDLLDA